MVTAGMASLCRISVRPRLTAQTQASTWVPRSAPSPNLDWRIRHFRPFQTPQILVTYFVLGTRGTSMPTFRLKDHHSTTSYKYVALHAWGRVQWHARASAHARASSRPSARSRSPSVGSKPRKSLRRMSAAEVRLRWLLGHRNRTSAAFVHGIEIVVLSRARRRHPAAASVDRHGSSTTCTKDILRANVVSDGALQSSLHALAIACMHTSRPCSSIFAPACAPLGGP